MSEWNKMLIRICLDRFEIEAAHGVYDFEDKPQPFIIDLAVEFERHRLDDELEQTIDYAWLQQVIADIFRQERVYLMETLAQQIIDALSSKPMIETIKIRIEKPLAVLPEPSGLPSIEVEWSRT
ncbi:MAG: dihydroneopterin aldolase [Candidatus Thermoplasmatota archaeon]|nr:hypothetical protein [Euryarchaeota archaeon]MED5350306.1 dihydroneopterin aldolase [Candidatus Thermoplasmatota archaeon]|tara:strand:+ start:535 stop:906 length:372 start_codon:yes stop_codon:yes gene_type:complete